MEDQSGVIKWLIKRILSGGKILNISLPVQVFNKYSNLNLLLTSLRHAPRILEPASNIADPLLRFLQVVRFSLTVPHCYIKLDKPFNPVLGETSQVFVDGTPFYGEQISHQPPISALLIKGHSYTLSGSFQARVDFGLNSASGSNVGWVIVNFGNGRGVRFTNPCGQMSGLIFGSRRFSLQGSCYYLDDQNLIYTEMVYGKIKHQLDVKNYEDSVEAMIYRLKTREALGNPQKVIQEDLGEKLGLIHGRWLDKVYFNGQLLIDTLAENPPEICEYPAVLQSDVSLREDVLLKIEGDEEKCQLAKEEIEELQRNDRKLREHFNAST